MRTKRSIMSFQGMGVHFRVCSPDSGVITHRALFVCSPAGDTENWKALMRMLTDEGCLCVAVDLPGFGESECGEHIKQDNDTRARILWGILDEVDALRGEQLTAWHIIGHGGGCAVVMTMSLYQPDSTLSQTLISPVLDRFTPLPIHSLIKTRLGGKCVDIWYKLYITNKKRFKKLAKRLYGARLNKDRLARVYKSLNREGMRLSFKRLIHDGYTFPQEAYGGFGPVMLIWGTRDTIFGNQPPKRLLKRLENAEKHLVNAAFFMMETHPDMLRDYLSGWFRYTEGGDNGVVRRPDAGVWRG